MSRRTFLTGAAGLGALALGAAACGRDDASVFAQGATSSTTPTSGATSSTSAARASTTTRAPSTATTVPSSTTAPTTTTSVASAGDAVHGELVTDFTYALASSGGRVNNPYVAVWVETPAGQLVDTIALWYLQSQKGNRYLPELRRWYTASGSTRSSVVSSATRAPGAYHVTWDATDTAGQAVAAGDYALCIEAAREHGPYSLIRQTITLGRESFRIDLPDNGELRDASATFTAR